MTYTVGQTVSFSFNSSHGPRTVTGTIALEVPANVDPQVMPEYRDLIRDCLEPMFCPKKRRRVSWMIKVKMSRGNKDKLYWPVKPNFKVTGQ